MEKNNKNEMVQLLEPMIKMIKKEIIALMRYNLNVHKLLF